MVQSQNYSGMLSLLEEKQLRIEAATMGATIALSRLGLIKDEISQREAFRIAGEALVRTWLANKYLSRINGKGRNSKVTYSRIEVETLLSLYQKGKLK